MRARAPLRTAGCAINPGPERAICVLVRTGTRGVVGLLLCAIAGACVSCSSEGRTPTQGVDVAQWSTVFCGGFAKSRPALDASPDSLMEIAPAINSGKLFGRLARSCRSVRVSQTHAGMTRRAASWRCKL
jgi:hypothetical protein